MRDDEKIYLDPEGWFSVYVPLDWEENGSPGTFSGKDGFVEIGYLPDMMFVRSAFSVCTWLANIDTKDVYSVSWISTNHERSAHSISCELTSLPGIHPAIVLEIIQNPSADLPQRFLFIKADPGHFDRIASTLVWLRPVDFDAKPAFQAASLRPEDISFWENTAPLPPGISVTEYELPEEVQNEEPGGAFQRAIPPEAHLEPIMRDRSIPPYGPNSRAYVNEMLEPFGYELRSGIEAFELYLEGELVLNNIFRLPSVHLFSTPTGDLLAFFVQTVKDIKKPFYEEDNPVIYLVQNETISIWQEEPLKGTDPGKPPIWVAGDLLVLGIGDHDYLEVRNSQRDLVFSFASSFSVNWPLRGFQSWDDHWVMDMTHFIIQDGEILNEKFNIDDAFYWKLIDDKPFYFFRKGPRVGISYNGQFLPLSYDDIPFGYG